MTKKQHYMTRDERLQLEALRRSGVPVARIARQLGFTRQTIYNELRRGACHQIKQIHGIERDVIEYSADIGQRLTEWNQTAKGGQLKIAGDREYADYLERKIRSDRYSPAAALAAARAAGFRTSICIATLYSYIDKGIFRHLTNKDLWVKSKRQRRGYRTVSRIVHPKLPSITQRPALINERKELGHWEMDLVVGKAGTAPVLLTLTERLSRMELIFKLPDHKASTIRGVFDQLERKDRDFCRHFKSITTDNGPEFLEYDKLRRSIRGGIRFDVYYCHSYAAWEKGTNENQNRMIRRFFPKGTDFRKISKKQIAAIQDWMNGYPRKVLNWATPAEVARECA